MAHAIVHMRAMRQLRGENMLLSQEEVAELPAKFRWGHSAISHILSKFENEEGSRTAFPCIFARNVVKRGNLRFLLIPYEPEKSGYELSLLASGLRTYIDQINIDALDINHNRSLLVLFEPLAPHDHRSIQDGIHRSDAVSAR